MKKINVEGRKVVFTNEGAQIKPYSIEQLKTDEILVKARCSLISVGTETTIYLKNRWDDSPIPDDSGWDFDSYGSGEKWDLASNMNCPGYALAGDVIETGKDNGIFKVGDRVISLVNHCNYAVCSVKPEHTLKIPDNVSYEESTFSVLASVALHGIRRSNLKIGEDVVIMGAGLVGLLLVQLAKKCGAYPVISCDISDTRLDLARKCGANFVIDPNKEDIVQKVREITGFKGSNCIIEATGIPKVLKNCLKVAVPGGRVVIMGAILGEEAMDLYSEFVFRELNLIAAQQPRNPVVDSIYYHFTGQKNRMYLLGLLERGELNVRDLLTHRFHYSKVPEVYKLLGIAKSADLDTGEGSKNRDMIGVLLDWED